mgnify:CR=1 FL=1|tara:strand:+ start:385 stop:684 length:300 start_codon:yes stop_codon:yes gene_type:complete
MYYLGAVGVLVTLIYYKNKSLTYKEKCQKVSLKTSPLELQSLFGAPVESRQREDLKLEYIFETNPMMEVVTRAVFDKNSGQLEEFYCGEKVLVGSDAKD